MYNLIDLTQTIVKALRNQGHDIPELVSEEDANTHFGEELSVGKRYLCSESGKLKVYNGDIWLIQKTS